MPTLYLMQGPSGSGKTAFLHRWRLDDLVVSPDAMRDMANPFDHVAGDTAHSYRDYSPETSVEAFELAETLCRARMRLGSTVIIDSCAVSRRSIDRSFLSSAIARLLGFETRPSLMDEDDVIRSVSKVEF